ncbi:MAG: DUF1559 domain-containing protein, partial [Planctomycetaceae bacterium]|nr:DUF1559 domain-containing protein [Planctomycetaceae bacterium]
SMPDPTEEPQYSAFSSYAFSRGNVVPESAAAGPVAWKPDDGVIISRLYQKVKFRDITDGTSNTILAGEMHYNLKGWTFTRGDRAGESRSGNTNWVWGHPGQGTVEASTSVSLNTTQYVDRSAPNAWQTSGLYAFRSTHSGGAGFALSDGSVRFISESIDRDLYRALGSRNGGEVVSEF